MKHARRLHLFTKRHEVGLLPFLQAPLLVRPERPGGTDARLDLVDDEECTVFLGDEPEGTEEGGRGVFVAAFGEDGLDDDGCHWFVGFANGSRLFISRCFGGLQTELTFRRESFRIPQDTVPPRPCSALHSPPRDT